VSVPPKHDRRGGGGGVPHGEPGLTSPELGGLLGHVDDRPAAHNPRNPRPDKTYVDRFETTIDQG